MTKVADNKKQILLVDDDKTVTDVLTILFETRGYKVTVANSGREALEKATRNTDLILLDVILPDREGFQICKTIKEAKETAHIKIIMLTGKTLTQDVVEGLYLGADDYLTKPFEYEELVARMEAVMRRSNSEGANDDSFNGQGDIICELRKIIDDELITPYFQPIFYLNPLKLIGFESLSRPKTNSILSAPDLLFKYAIKYGVYQDIEMLAWKKTLEYAAAKNNGKKLFLNCNPYLIEGSKFWEIKNLFEKAGIDPQNVYLEITERSAITNFKKFYEDLNVYRDYGFNFAIDDVGGGYASLEAIIETRPEVVKIDRHIVHKMSEDSLRRSIVKFIVSLCKEHNIMSLAEGIEIKDDFEIAKQLGVDAGQGYYFQKPAPGFMTSDEIISKMSDL